MPSHSLRHPGAPLDVVGKLPCLCVCRDDLEFGGMSGRASEHVAADSEALPLPRAVFFTEPQLGEALHPRVKTQSCRRVQRVGGGASVSVSDGGQFGCLARSVAQAPFC